MRLQSTTVGLLQARVYDRRVLKDSMDNLLQRVDCQVGNGSKVLLKPNLITARQHDGLACTHPEFIAAAAECFLDRGASVTIGDSPAFGSARRVMAACSITRALAGLPVRLVDFNAVRRLHLEDGTPAGIAAAALECDYLVNLPRVKAHGQLLVSMAVKNYFGTVVGWRKPCLHMQLGKPAPRFAAFLVGLLDLLPGGVSLVDGITAMHKDGPIRGSAYPLGIMACSPNPVAVDTALLKLLSIEPLRSPLWRESQRRGLPGSGPESLRFPLARPEELAVHDFLVPAVLRPVRFQPAVFLRGSFKRVASRLARR